MLSDTKQEAIYRLRNVIDDLNIAMKCAKDANLKIFIDSGAFTEPDEERGSDCADVTIYTQEDEFIGNIPILGHN